MKKIFNKENIKKKIAGFPKNSGIYFFLNKCKDVIYIGKATNLKTRVMSYFLDNILEKRGPIIEKMISDIDDVKIKETDNAIEALILESHRIKEIQPKYNTKEKSGKSFVYILITNEEFPKILIKREKEILEKRSEFFKKKKIWKTIGPFSSRKNLEKSLQIIRRIFPFYSSEKTYTKYSNIYEQIGLAPKNIDAKNDNLNIDKEILKKYKENIKNIALFFEGKKKRIIKKFEKKMFEFAKKEDFEIAGLYKDKIKSLKNISDFQINFSEDDLFFKEELRIEAYDIAHFQGSEHVGVMTVIENDQKNSSEYRKFLIKSFDGIDDNRALKEILKRRFFHKKWKFPNIIVADGGIAQKRTIEKFLRENKNKIKKNISVVACKKNKSHKVVSILGKKEIVLKNKQSILLANFEAHRFAITFHRNKMNDNFLK